MIIPANLFLLLFIQFDLHIRHTFSLFIVQYPSSRLDESICSYLILLANKYHFSLYINVFLVLLFVLKHIYLIEIININDLQSDLLIDISVNFFFFPLNVCPCKLFLFPCYLIRPSG